MTVQTQIVDSTTKQQSKVTKRGELVVGPFDFSDPKFNSLDVDDAAFNFFRPKPGMQFVITTMIADADRNVGANGASVNIYEATAVNSTTVTKSILQFDMIKQTSKVMTGLHFAVTEGVWLNAKSDDSNILITIAGYYVNT